MMVELKNISFGYNNAKLGKANCVLHDLTFSVESGKRVSIVGSSGCGKSTLLRLISGLLPNTKDQFSGEILLDGKNIISNLGEWKERLSLGHLGFMFQEHNLLPNMTVEENIHLPLRILGKSTGAEELVANYLKIIGLDCHSQKLPDKLSGGMRTRTALARTFISEPKLLLLDEPFASLDIIWKSKLYEETRDLINKSKTTVILVTHDIFEAIFFSDDIIILGANHTATNYKIEKWSASSTYDEVISKYNKDFVKIKCLI